MQPTPCCFPVGFTIGIGHFSKRIYFHYDGIMNPENRGILVPNLRLPLAVSIWSIALCLWQRKKSGQWTQLFHKHRITNVMETFLQNEWILIIHLQLHSFWSWKTKGKNDRIRNHTGIWKRTYHQCFFGVTFTLYGEKH